MRSTIAILVALFMLLPPAQAQEAVQAASLRALIDKPVLSLQGDSLGLLKSIAVNVDTGEAPWGVLLTGRNIVVIPTRALAFDSLGLLGLQMSLEDFARAPRWRISDFPQINQPNAVQRIAKAYGFRTEASQRAVAAVGEGTAFRLLGSPIPSAPTEDFTNRVRVIGDRVTTVHGAPVGIIVDLLVELKAATVRLVAVEGDGHRTALPYPGLVWQANARSFATELSIDELKRQPRADWPERDVVSLSVAQRPAE